MCAFVDIAYVGKNKLYFGRTSQKCGNNVASVWCNVMMSYDAFVNTKWFDFVKAVMKPSPAYQMMSFFIRKIVLMCPKSPLKALVSLWQLYIYDVMTFHQIEATSLPQIWTTLCTLAFLVAIKDLKNRFNN